MMMFALPLAHLLTPLIIALPLMMKANNKVISKSR
jgi:hypothetical protein